MSRSVQVQDKGKLLELMRLGPMLPASWFSIITMGPCYGGLLLTAAAKQRACASNDFKRKRINSKPFKYGSILMKLELFTKLVC